MSEFFDELITGLNEAVAIERDELKGRITVSDRVVKGFITEVNKIAKNNQLNEKDGAQKIMPSFHSMDVRTAFYTTNSIESLNSCFRRLNKQRSVFPSSQALMKALYLSTFEIIKKWTMPIRN